MLDEEIPQLQKFVLLEDIAGKYSFNGQAPKYVDYEKYIGQFKPSAKALPKQDLSCHDMVNVEFTSGSTGLPKNVALSHYNIMNCGRFIWQQVRMVDDDRICLPVPLFHSFGMIVGEYSIFVFMTVRVSNILSGLSSSAVAGSALVFPSELFNAKAALECIHKYKCTAVYGVPTMFVTEMSHDDFPKTDRSSIR